MSTSESKQIASRAAQALFNDKDLSQVDTLFAESFVDHSAPEGAPQGRAGQRAKVEAFIAAFPDLQITYTHQIAEGDLVSGRFVLRGTHQGDFAGVAATGNAISVVGHDLLRITDGLIVEHWTVIDSAELMRQLGVQ